MVKFLSSEWLESLAARLTSPPDAELTIQHFVTDADSAYWIRFASGSATAGTGSSGESDITFTSDRETAAALSRSEVVPQAAFMQGRLDITGNLSKLIKHQDLVGALGPAMASIETEY